MSKKSREQHIADELEKLDRREAKLEKLLDHYVPIAMLGAVEEKGPLGIVKIIPETTKNAVVAVDKMAAQLKGIQERRAKYLDLDAAEKVDVTRHDGDATPAEARSLMQAAFGAVTPNETESDSDDNAAAAPIIAS